MISRSKWKKQEADKCVSIDDALFPLTVTSSTCDHDPGSVLCLTSDGAFANVHGIIVPKHLYMGSVYSCSLQYLRIHTEKEINCIGQRSVCSYSLLQSEFSALATWVTEARGAVC